MAHRLWDTSLVHETQIVITVPPTASSRPIKASTTIIDYFTLTGIFHGVLERFWLQPSVCLSTVAGVAAGMAFTQVRERLNCPAVRFIFLSLAAAAVAYQVRVQ